MTQATFGFTRRHGDTEVEFRETARAAAISALAKWLRAGTFPSRSLPASSPFALEIANGVLRNLSALDFAIARLCRRKPDAAARAVLLAGLWQLLYGNNIPAYAAINETVEAAKRIKSVSVPFVNGVLRNAARNAKSLLEAIAAAPLHIAASHPEEIVRRWTVIFGEETARRLCESGQGIPPVTAFPLPFRDETAAAELAASWREAGIDAGITEKGRGLVVPHGVEIDKLPGYAEGRFIIQDCATLLSVGILEPKRGETVLDCCAAPGGKTMQIASLVGEEGRVIALDDSAPRLSTMRENLRRTRLDDRVGTAVCDATSQELAERLRGRRIDAILVDAPCSNSGVFARRPEARWRWSAEETKRLAGVQLAILENVARLGAKRIVYSTCSIDPEENGQVVERFLASEAGAGYRLVRSETLLPIAGEAWDGGRFLPNDWHDGAFAALLALL